MEHIIKIGAAGIVLAHNHPANTCKPSFEDIDSTKHIEKLLANFDIKIIEHFVVSGDKYCGILKMSEIQDANLYSKYNL